MIYFLALGSNMGDRRSNMEQAIALLERIGRVLKVSSIYETTPVAMAPDAGNFYNLVLSLDSDLSPYELLKVIKEIEKKMGRDVTTPAASHNKPRTMDIDILLAEEQVINTEDLTIPHKEMHRRDFVLVPLNEIAPPVIHPVLKQKISEIFAHSYH